MSNLRVVDPHAEAKANVVEMARDVLAMAERGELIDLTYCASRRDGAVSHGMTPTDDQMRRIAAVSRLHHLVHLAADEAATGL